MPPVFIFPYYRTSGSRVTCEGWDPVQEDAILDGDTFPDWEYNTPVQMRQVVAVDATGIYEDCRLRPDSIVVVACSWYSPGTSLRGAGNSVKLNPQDEAQEALLSIDVDGSLLASEIRITTSVILVKSAGTGGLSPHLPGSILWDHEYRLLLEGGGARFPLEMTDFSENFGLPDGAPWFLEWSYEQPAVPLLGNVRLLINSEHDVVHRAVRASRPNAEQKLVRSTMYYDVGRAMIRGMLANNEFVENPEGFEEGSIGYHVNSMIKLFLAGESISDLSMLMKERPEHFEAKLKAGFRLFEME